MQCVTMMKDQNVKKVDVDVTNSNVFQSHAVTILIVMMVKSVLVNVVITQTSTELTLPMVKNQIPVSKLTVWDMTTVVKRNDVIATNVFQLIVELKNIVVNRNSVKMPSVSRLNAVTINTVKDSSLIRILHTNVFNKLVKLLNVLLLLIVVQECSVIKHPMSVTNQNVWDMPVAKKLLVAKMVNANAKPKRIQMVLMLVINALNMNAESMITVQKQKNFVTLTLTHVTKSIVQHMITVTRKMVTKNVLQTFVKRLTVLLMHTVVH